MAFQFTPQQPQQQQTSLFGQPQPQQQSPFQPSPFFNQQQQPQPQQNQFQQQQQQQQQQQNQLFLFTNDKTPASYGTKWADLHPDSQKFLLQIEERILEYRDESQRLDQCGRLYDSSVSSDGFELDASHIVQELGGISTAMDRQKILLHELTASVKDMLRNTEIAVRSFMMLRSKFIHPNKTSAVTSQSSGATATTTPQPTTTAMVPVYDFYSGMPRKPSPFLQQTVARFDKYLGECRQWIEELEQLLLLESNKRNALNSNSSLLESLPKVMSNVHDFFVYVAAKVESIHQYMESMKTAYLADQRDRGDGNDPFLEADRREIAKQAAAAKRVHPTLHLPSNSQPSTQAGGLLTSSTTPAASAAAPASASAPAGVSGSAPGLFSSPFAGTSSSLFSTPATTAPSFSMFSSSSASPQTSLFSGLSSTTPSLFNTSLASTSTSFATNPTTGASSFSTPFGTATASGSFTTAKPRNKTRSTRR
ncbi:hydroxyproline-rich glycoprotein family protein [Artemisia annua]|uniref:Hydroxyproline-rich glycoprotein family protein n=1 Tax=Artemisia annua TaxID=35608 RepID=A0A2U1P976_ARTAN|nr:hydroxyproline-rich glycoprotein family protein [Artemisia annua]